MINRELEIELLEAKEALCTMTVQFMHTTLSGNGTRYFNTCCESAGESCFAALGIGTDYISEAEFYKLYDAIEDELWMKKFGKPCPFKRSDILKKSKEAINHALR